MRDQKQRLREQVLLQRRAFLADDVARWNRAIQERVFSIPVYFQAKSVALYSSIGSEVDTEVICDNALRSGKSVYFPRASGGSMGFLRINAPSDLRRRSNGILEPVGGDPLPQPISSDLVLFIPGLAFDLDGNRLGRGRGWYDRALSSLGATPVRIGLAFEFQIVESLPIENWDQKVHQIVTEKRIIRCNGPVSE